MAVTLGWRALGRLARHRGRAGRHNDGRLGMALGDAGVDSFLIVGPVTRERSDRTRDLVEQGANLGAVIHVVGGQRRRDDPARVSIHTEVELTPRTASSRAMLLDQPLPGPAELQPRAVHQQMNGLGLAARPRPRHLQGLGSAAQGGMVGNRESEAEQTDDRPDQAFGLAQRQAEYGLEGQRRRDRQIRIVRLTARRGARLGLPSRNCRLREPHRQAPTLAQGGIVFGPVRHPAPLLGDVMAARGIGLERHRGSRVTEGVVHLRQPSPDANRPIRATNSLALVILVRDWRCVALTGTAFTVAHRVTLAAATLGLGDLPGPPLEAAIALSIVLVAVEIVNARRGRPALTARRPWLVAFCFGLLHGFGFAGALAEVGLPHHAIPIALLFFNLGVEIGQLAFVGAVLTAGWMFHCRATLPFQPAPGRLIVKSLRRLST